VTPSGAAIVGVGASDYYKRGRSVPLTQLDLINTAVRAALDDAGLGVADVDGFSYYAKGLDTALIAHSLGVPQVRFVGALTGGGGGAAGSIGMAATAVTSGWADVVVTVMVLQQAGYRLGRTGASSDPANPYAAKHTPEEDFTIPFGMVGVGAKFAMVVKRHMHLYGTSRDAFAEIAMSTRANALTRPKALMTKPMTLDDYFGARTISTSADRAKDLRQKPVHVLGSSMGGVGRYGHPIGWMNAPDDYFASAFSDSVAAEVYAKAGVGPADIDAAEMYDHFAPMVLLQLEAFGFCGRGESGDFVQSGAIRWPTGSLPLNTHGGHLSEVYVMGMTHVVEAVEQLRGTAINQVHGARTALVTGGPAAIPVSAAVLATEPRS
jgi:acetyl-CoA acetyltransferase